MKKGILVCLCMFQVLMVFGQKPQPVKVIFDTDMGPDYDDVGAIAMLHALDARGECEILACMASDSHELVAPTIDLYNQYFKRPDIPIGLAVTDAPGILSPNNWNDSLFNHFELSKNAYEPAVGLYRKILANQPDASVVIITVGFASNLAALLETNPDEYSELSGLELVRKKVLRWVTMAGRFPEGNEFNVRRVPDASYSVYRDWPTPILFSGFEIGLPILTGGPLKELDPKKNPVAWAYEYNSRTYKGQKGFPKVSFDQTAVLVAIRAPEDYFYVLGPGTFKVFKDGTNEWIPEGGKQHFFLAHKYPYEKIEEVIDELMIYEP